jgi:Ca-activated chloride channel homolog
MKQDYYSILGIPRTASPEEIRHAYFQAARQYHPDLNTMPGDTEYFISAKEAFDILSNQKKRKKYDESLPPLEASDIPLTFEAIYSRDHLIQMDEPQLVYALLKLSDPEKTKSAKPRIPLNICLVIDRSSSMKGRKLDHAKASSIQLIKRLNPQDSFSMVAFSDKAEIITAGKGEENSSKIESKIYHLLPSGGTEIFNGLEAGYSEIQQKFDPNGINHIILLTDGRTYGDEDLCLDLASKAAKQGIGISGLGIGSDWNDVFMDTLTSATGGNCYFVSKPEEISERLLERFEQISHFRAQSISLTFEDLKSSKINCAMRILPEPGLLPLENPIVLGPFFDTSDLSILLEFVVTVPINSSLVELLDGNLNILQRAQVPIPNVIQVNLKLPVHPSENDNELPPQKIVQAISELTFYRIQEKGRKEAASGEFEEAIGHLQIVATHALQKGKNELYQLIQSEVESIRTTHALTPEGEKKIKYGTKALFNTSFGDEVS